MHCRDWLGREGIRKGADAGRHRVSGRIKDRGLVHVQARLGHALQGGGRLRIQQEQDYGLSGRCARRARQRHDGVPGAGAPHPQAVGVDGPVEWLVKLQDQDGASRLSGGVGLAAGRARRLAGHPRRAAMERGTDQIGRFGVGGFAAELDYLDSAFSVGGDCRVIEAARIEHIHAVRAPQPGVAGVGEVAGGARAGRVGYIDYLEGGIIKDGDRRVDAAVPLKDCHAGGGVKLGAGRLVVDVAGGGQIVRVGYIDYLEGVIDEGGDRRVRFIVPLKDGHPVGAAKQSVYGVAYVAGGGRIVRVGYIDYLEGGIV